MNLKTGIEWTDFTANPLKYRDAKGKDVWACAKVSPGCKHCYSEALAARYRKGGPFNEAEVAKLQPYLAEDELLKLLTSKSISGKRGFLFDMTDLFGEWVPDEMIAAVFGVFAARPDVTFQVLTKRAERMAQVVPALTADVISEAVAKQFDDDFGCFIANYLNGWSRWAHQPDDGNPLDGTVPRWPLRNVWLGVSVEDQAHAIERIPHLLRTPAAVRFLSCEPLLGPLNLHPWLCRYGSTERPEQHFSTMVCERREAGIDWVIAGGESGPGARPCALEWLQSLVDQCRAASCPVFVKQVGSYVVAAARTAPVHLMPGPPESYANFRAPNGEVWAWRQGLKDRKGGDPDEWPEELRVRQWPEVARAK